MTARKDKLVVQAISDFKGFVDGDIFIGNFNSADITDYFRSSIKILRCV